MADNPTNTILSRRTVVAAGLAALAPAAVCAISSSAIASMLPNPDGELIGLCQQWIAQEITLNEMIGHTGDLGEAASAKSPPYPPELSEKLDLPDGFRNRGDGQPWEVRDLQAFADGGGCVKVENSNIDNTHTISVKNLPISEETRQRSRELIKIYEKWERKKKRIWKNARASERRDNKFAHQQWTLLERISEMHPQTLEGLRAQNRILIGSDLLVCGHSEVIEKFTVNLLNNLEKLAG